MEKYLKVEVREYADLILVTTDDQVQNGLTFKDHCKSLFTASEIALAHLNNEEQAVINIEDYNKFLKWRDSPPPDDRAERLRIAVEMMKGLMIAYGGNIEEKEMDECFTLADALIAKSKE